MPITTAPTESVIGGGCVGAAVIRGNGVSVAQTVSGNAALVVVHAGIVTVSAAGVFTTIDVTVARIVVIVVNIDHGALRVVGAAVIGHHIHIQAGSAFLRICQSTGGSIIR